MLLIFLPSLLYEAALEQSFCTTGAVFVVGLDYSVDSQTIVQQHIVVEAAWLPPSLHPALPWKLLHPPKEHRNPFCQQRRCLTRDSGFHDVT